MSALIVAPQITRVFGVLRRRNDTLSPAAEAFLEVARAVFRNASPVRKNAVKTRDRAKSSAPSKQREKSAAL
jgi:hypothetical protein